MNVAQAENRLLPDFIPVTDLPMLHRTQSVETHRSRRSYRSRSQSRDRHSRRHQRAPEEKRRRDSRSREKKVEKDIRDKRSVSRERSLRDKHVSYILMENCDASFQQKADTPFQPNPDPSLGIHALLLDELRVQCIAREVRMKRSQGY